MAFYGISGSLLCGPLAGSALCRAGKRLSSDILVRLWFFHPTLPGKGRTDSGSCRSPGIFLLAGYSQELAAGNHGGNFYDPIVHDRIFAVPRKFILIFPAKQRSDLGPVENDSLWTFIRLSTGCRHVRGAISAPSYNSAVPILQCGKTRENGSSPCGAPVHAPRCNPALPPARRAVSS